MTAKKRQSGIELLRIIAMLQIIFLHVCQYGKLYSTSKLAGDIDGLIVVFAWALCRAPVDVFVMISGYFMITSKADIPKTIERAKKPYGAMIFYSVVISIIFFITTPSLIDVNSVLSAVLPFFSKQWYFLSNYIIILLLSPFINKMLVSLSQKQYLYFTGIIFIVMSVWSTLAGIKGFDKIFDVAKIVDPYLGKSLGGFLLFYIIGGYIRLFVPQEKKQKGLNFKYFLIFLALCIIDFMLGRCVPEYKNVFGMFNNPLVIFESVMLILFFRDFKFSSSFVNLFASTTLGVYAIHEHPYVRKWLWSVISFKDKSLYDNLSYILLAVLTCVGIFVICSLIEILRTHLFKLAENLFSAINMKRKLRKSLSKKG